MTFFFKLCNCKNAILCTKLSTIPIVLRSLIFHDIRAGWPNGFPGELFRFPVQHWDFWLRMRETLNQLRERYEAHKARRARVLQQMSAARAAELARKETTYAQEPIEMKKSTDVTERDLNILNTESDVESMVGQDMKGQKLDDGSVQGHFLRSSRVPHF